VGRDGKTQSQLVETKKREGIYRRGSKEKEYNRNERPNTIESGRHPDKESGRDEGGDEWKKTTNRKAKKRTERIGREKTSCKVRDAHAADTKAVNAATIK